MKTLEEKLSELDASRRNTVTLCADELARVERLVRDAGQERVAAVLAAAGWAEGSDPPIWCWEYVAELVIACRKQNQSES